MKKFTYILKTESGDEYITTQIKKVSSDEILKIFQDAQPSRKYIKCEFDKEIPDGKHLCKYCGEIADGNYEDLLCKDCRMTFGHALYSEL